jgi:DNA-binding PadR family transcriptional regulator
MSTELTTTSYAILGLLAVRPWTTYELAQQMERSLKSFWPRAASRIYEEPKRLAALGLARATPETVGRRPRTVYAITAKGRRALQRWLAEPGSGPSLEFDALLRVFFAEHSTRAGVLANLGAIQEWAAEQQALNVAFARLYLESGGPFPGRLPAIVLPGRFLTEMADAVDRWATWATSVVEEWPEDPSAAEPAWDALREVAARAVDRPLPPV